MTNSNSSWTLSPTVMYGCIPIDPWPGVSPEIPPNWYEPFPLVPGPYPFDPAPSPYMPPTNQPTQTPEQRIASLEYRCSLLEKRILELENRPSIDQGSPIGVIAKPHEPAVLPCTCDELPPDALHWEGCPAGRDSRSHDDGLEFLRVWIDGHFGKLSLDSTTLHKIKAMIDSIGPKIRRRSQRK